MTSLTIENYVKTIYAICSREKDKPASTGAIAAALNVSPSTVTSMLKSLREMGIAQYTPYEGVSLTESGQRLALRVLRRHRLIELFLATTLNLTWDEVHEEAEHLEHAVSDRLINKIDEHLGFPTSDPHGDPIPTADGDIKSSDSQSLVNWQIGESFELARVLDQSASFLRYLSDTGMCIGARGKVVSRRKEAAIVTVQLAETEEPLSYETAEKLLVVRPRD